MRKIGILISIFLVSFSISACGNNKINDDSKGAQKGNSTDLSNEIKSSDSTSSEDSVGGVENSDNELSSEDGFGSDWDTTEWITISDRYDTHTSWFIDYYNNDRFLIHVWGETEDGETVDFYHFDEDRNGAAELELQNGRYSIVTMMSSYGPINASVSNYGDVSIEEIANYDNAVFNVVMTEKQLMTDLTRQDHYFSASTETDGNGNEKLRGLYLPVTYIDFPKHNTETIEPEQMTQEDVDDVNVQISDIIEKNDGSISDENIMKIQSVLDAFNQEWEKGSSYTIE